MNLGLQALLAFTPIALSGILSGQEDELLHRYAPWFDAPVATRLDDWIRIDGVREGDVQR